MNSNFKFIRFFIISLVLILKTSAGQETVEHLSLSALIKQAEQVDSEYLTLQKEHQANLSNTGIALSKLLPQASSQYSNNVEEDDWVLGVNITQDVLNLPNYRNWQAANIEKNRISLNLQQALTTLRKKIVLQWIDYQLKVDTLNLLYTREKTLKSQLNNAQILVSAGNVTQSDVLAAQANLANIQAQIQQAQYEISTAQYKLQKSTHAGAKAQKLLLTQTTLPPIDSMETWWQRIQKNNLSLKIIKKNLEIEEKKIEAVTATIYPRLSIELGSQATNGFSNRTETINLIARQSLFTGGLLTHEQEKILAQLASMRLAIKAQEEMVQQNLFETLGQMNAYIAQIQALTKAQQSSQLLLESTIISYKNGVNTYNDVLTAEERLFDVQSQRRKVIFDYIMNWVELHSMENSLDDSSIQKIETFFST